MVGVAGGAGGGGVAAGVGAVGCAGGVERSLYVEGLEFLKSSDDFEGGVGESVEQYTSVLNVDISGAHGGHSGGDIHSGYCNVNKFIVELLLEVTASEELKDVEMSLVSLKGGNGPTAISRV